MVEDWRIVHLGNQTYVAGRVVWLDGDIREVEIFDMSQEKSLQSVRRLTCQSLDDIIELSDLPDDCLIHSGSQGGRHD